MYVCVLQVVDGKHKPLLFFRSARDASHTAAERAPGRADSRRHVDRRARRRRPAAAAAAASAGGSARAGAWRVSRGRWRLRRLAAG